MTTVLIYLLVVFAAGLLALAARLPPLVGFLAAGFFLNGMGVPEINGLDVISDLGVTLMLFAIGLKLNVKSLLGKEVWLTATAHMAGSVIVGSAFLGVLAWLGVLTVSSIPVIGVLAFALSFSSTVFVIKILQDRGDELTLYGRIAIGVLIVQDLAAVVFISVSRGTPPNPWALGLVVIVPLLWWIFQRFDRFGRAEMQALFGILMAFVPGYALFEYLGLHGSLGALVMGMVLASYPGANQLSRSLFMMKELLLIGFFVSIGFTGLPDTRNVVVGLLLLLLLPIQGAGYWALLWLQGMRHRTGLLAGLLLSNYSEFGLIVAAMGVEQGWLPAHWLVTIAIAVAASFVVSAVVNPRNTSSLSRIANRFASRPPEKLHPRDRPIPINNVEALVLGMGRVGTATYAQLTGEYGMCALGVEHNPQRVVALRRDGFNVVEGDATDTDFWDRVAENHGIEIIVLTMPSQHANTDALRAIREREFTGTVAAVALYQSDVEELHDWDIDVVVHMYGGAGRDLADQSVEARRDQSR